MATTASRQRKRAGTSASRQSPVKVAKTAAKATSAAVSTGGSKGGGLPSVSTIARRLALKGLKKVASRTFESGAEALRATVERTAETAMTTVGSNMRRRLPIQRSVDVAVPVRVAWEEWMALDILPEGVHRVEVIERDGDELSGQTSGPHNREWAADILDERERESFAWQSVQGSDCAGLVTFHELSDRLTRIELGLDVVPTNVAEALALSTHLADRHAEADLRRLKARLEFINPDTYENDEET